MHAVAKAAGFVSERAASTEMEGWVRGVFVLLHGYYHMLTL